MPLCSFAQDGNPDKALPCGQSPPCVKAVEAQSKNKQGASRYLRIQVVGFAPSEMGWLDRMRVRLGLKEEAPKLRIVTPTPTKAQKPTSRAAQVRREVNYLAIDPTLRCVHVTQWRLYVWVAATHTCTHVGSMSVACC